MALESKAAPQPFLWLALLLTLGLVYWQWSQEDTADVTVVAANTNGARSASETPANPVPQATVSQTLAPPVVTSSSITPLASTPDNTYFTRQLPAAKLSHALFAAHEWLPPPPKPQPPPPPEVPPLPYTYVGSMQDVPGGDTVILMQQKKMLLPKLGSNINAQWRLDREDAQSVYFTYVPLNKVVVLSKTKTTSGAGQRQALTDNNQDEMLNQ
ncbi:hypothetical protein [Methylophilus sp. UBA6697]|uniref:hypothetical protein n=1 Tax=Methylophilus sp. UBA6697 TaxID=1946902 RepID=UPI000EC63046|nr:hypothetical protein [Methylophilus sp. UBA6697]HCU84808.1 hypothetical protein [Methylophilus sp.]